MGGSSFDQSSVNYDIKYFAARNQDRDRPALWFYERLVRRWFVSGPVLDYGCGTGFLLKRLSRFYDVAGFDISPEALAVACANVRDLKVYHQDDQLPEATFSGIVSLHVLEHIERTSIPSVLKHWHRSLLPRGRVLCVVPDADGRGHSLAGKYWTSFGDPTHVTLLGHNEWCDLFIAADFSVHKIGTDGLWCLPYREGRGKIADGLRFSVPTLLQFLAGRLLLSAGSGESAIFLLERV
jgi:SAM-dependent methyltransferase